MNHKLKRNETLDLLKLIAAYMVVFIHVPFYGQMGMVVKALARFAVPVFFMTSGYFCYQNDIPRIRRKILKIASLLLFTSVLYNVMNIGNAYLDGGINEVSSLLAIYGEKSRWIQLLIFNKPFSATRLWFLFALIYVYLLQICFYKYKMSYKWIFILSTAGLLMNLILGEIFPVFGIQLDDMYTRNFLLTGYPFFGFGLLLHKHQEKGLLMKCGQLVVMLVIGMGLVVLSRYYAPYSMLTIGSVLMTIALFLLSLYHSDIKYPGWLMHICECSLGIYIFHGVLTIICSKLLIMIGMSKEEILYHTVLPILVCVSTTAMILILKFMIRYMNKKKPKD